MLGVRWRQRAGVVPTEQPIAPMSDHIVEGVADLAGKQVTDQEDSPDAAEIAENLENGRRTNLTSAGADEHDRVDGGEVGMLA